MLKSPLTAVSQVIQSTLIRWAYPFNKIVLDQLRESRINITTIFIELLCNISSNIPAPCLGKCLKNLEVCGLNEFHNPHLPDQLPVILA